MEVEKECSLTVPGRQKELLIPVLARLGAMEALKGGSVEVPVFSVLSTFSQAETKSHGSLVHKGCTT